VSVRPPPTRPRSRHVYNTILWLPSRPLTPALPLWMINAGVLCPP
jgi:hypothetical protein